CKVSEEEYVPAINEFDGVIQQNPNTEEAVYAEIDAITAAILIEEADSTLQKGTLGKYLVKPGENYLSKLDEILRKHFGNGGNETEKEILPMEYTLYQNYPNPFNPVTTIKYDLPNASDISLIIYDILGRKVKGLVNTKQAAGRYEVEFNASNLASGVYIYQLIAEKYINARKMILLK
ncbi:MAG: T9SS type A sorting domain-containing protein, partial [Ignavibacteriaceae bacterium]